MPTVLKQVVCIYNSVAVGAIEMSPCPWEFSVPPAEHVVGIVVNDAAITTVVELARSKHGRLVHSAATGSPQETNSSILGLAFEGLHLLHRSLNQKRDIGFVQFLVSSPLDLHALLARFPASPTTVDVVRSNMPPAHAVAFLVNIYANISSSDTISEISEAAATACPAAEIADLNLGGVGGALVNRQKVHALKQKYDPSGFLNSRMLYAPVT